MIGMTTRRTVGLVVVSQNIYATTMEHVEAARAVSSFSQRPGSVGVDQVNVLAPRSLAGRGEVEVLLTVEAQLANPARIRIN